MQLLDNIFQQNKAWADKIKKSDPVFFTKLSKQQNPEYLCIGCTDSRVPTNEIVNMNWQYMDGYTALKTVF